MVAPYTAVGLITTVWGVRRRAEIRRNIEHISHVIAAASWLSSLDLPVRLVAIPEGALQGFTDEVFDMEHEDYARECAIDVPGDETAALGELARKWDVFIIGQAKARHESFPGRFFNMGFIIDPAGQVVGKHYKLATLYPVEHSVTPHDVWDRWVELYGETLDAFYPVVDTEIGRLGIMMANEASYPENARGLAMNGAEVVYRASYPHPHTGQQYVRGGPEPRDVLPGAGLRAPRGHVWRALDGGRLHRPDRGPAPLRRGFVLRGRRRGRRGAPRPPRP